MYQKEIGGGQSFYDKYQIRKFGWWLGDCKRKPHQELGELMGSGAAKKLMKLFNNIELPVQLYIQFTPGGVDFVGAYTYYNFLKNNFGADGTPKTG